MKKRCAGVAGWQTPAQQLSVRPGCGVQACFSPRRKCARTGSRPECPADAIFADNEVPPEQSHFIELNADLAQFWPLLSQTLAPLVDADAWVDQADKLQFLER